MRDSPICTTRRRRHLPGNSLKIAEPSERNEEEQMRDDWFVRGYSVVNEMEDRATVIEAIFAEDSDWWDQHPHIRAKRDALLAAAEPVFGNVYYHE